MQGKSGTDSQEHANVPPRRVVLNGEPLLTSFVSKDKLEAVISPEAIVKADTYIVTLKREGELFPESHRAHLFELFYEYRFALGYSRPGHPRHRRRC